MTNKPLNILSKDLNELLFKAIQVNGDVDEVKKIIEENNIEPHIL